LTRKENFPHLVKYVMQLIVKNDGMYDVELMEELGKSPYSWKILKPKLIQKFALVTYERKNTKTGKECTYQIGYDKKEKFWEVINIKMN